MYKRENSIIDKHIDFIILDIICVQLAYVLSYILRHGLNMEHFIREYKGLGITIILLQICTIFFTENYKNILKRGYFEEFKKSAWMISIILMLVFAFLFITKTSEIFSRAVFILMWFLGILFVYLERIIWKKVLKKKMTRVEYLQNMIVITTRDRAEKTLFNMFHKEYRGFYIRGILLEEDEIKESDILGFKVLGKAEDIREILINEIVDEVFIDLPLNEIQSEKIRDDCKKMGITTHSNITDLLKDDKNMIVEKYAGHMVLTSTLKFAEPRQLFVKRVMDIVGGIIGLFLTFFLILVFGPIIYIQSPGPIFFSQERVGRNGRKFRIYKFRSMYLDAEKRKEELMSQNKMKGLMFKMDNDPRIIPIGHFMRKTSLDEFPQFWNVLKGDMSLVGTRPPTVDEYEKYEIHHKARLATKPGLTGMWQVSGRSDIVNFEEVVQLDMKYITEWNIGMDLRILFQTVKIVFTGKGSV